MAALVAAEPGEARGGAQFPELGFLLLGNGEGFAIRLFSGLGISLTRQQPSLLAVQFCFEPALPCPLNDL